MILTDECLECGALIIVSDGWHGTQVCTKCYPEQPKPNHLRHCDLTKKLISKARLSHQSKQAESSAKPFSKPL